MSRIEDQGTQGQESGQQQAGGTADQLRGAAQQVGEKIRDATGQIREQAGEKYENLREQAGQQYDQLREQAGQQYDQLRDQANQYYETGRQQAMEWEQGIEEYVRQQPVKSLLIAAGVGVILGAIWKRS